jgi:8-oxo-dGTP pyrophosphatase MutT (NUDIX family)
MPISEYLRALREKVGTTLVVVPSVTALIQEPDERVLLVRHSNGGVWLAPGGAVDPDEAPQDAIVREVWEETGLHVEPLGYLGVFGGPDFRVRYANGDQVSYVMSMFQCRRIGGEIRPDGDEVLEVRYFTPAEALSLELGLWARIVLPPLLARRGGAWIPPVTWRP